MLIHKKSSNVLYMLPVNLYNNDILTKIIESNDINKIILWEHPHFFKRRGYKFNKKKLVLHRASMKSYYDNVLLESSLDKKHISYIDFNKRHTISERKNNICIDPITVIPKFTVKMDKVIDSPNFLMTTTSLKKMNNYHFTQSFYKKVKDHINILTDTKSQDKSNRNVPNIKTVDIPKLSNLNNEKNNYVKEATTYVDKHFKNNYGTTDNFVYPVNHEDARNWLDHFILKKFQYFGSYQDAIIENEPYMFHSILSCSINIGLINPSEIIAIISDVNPLKNKTSYVPLNSYEGYIRQLIWREYQRYCYVTIAEELENSSYFSFPKTNKLKKEWYNGTTGITPIDHSIKNAFDNGYLHHIERLMLIGNYMMLNEISPNSAYKWFMEFAIDSYDWVMYQNVYDMVFFNTGGKTMRKPYITSSNYISNMSNYSNDEWCDVWDSKYNAFLKKYKSKLWKFRWHFPTLKNI